VEKRTGCGAARDLVHHRGLDLDEPLGFEKIANRLDDGRPLLEGLFTCGLTIRSTYRWR
jgi:hypothetical protein